MKAKKRIEWPLIRKRAYPSGKVGYQVDLGEIEGVRQRMAFVTKEEADAYAAQARIKRENEGLSAFTMQQDLRVDAVKASKLLESHGVSLVECAKHYVEHVAVYRNAPLLSEVVASLLKDATANGRRDRTIRDLRCRLTSFASDFPGCRLVDLTIEDVKEWAMDGEWKPRTRINYLTKISQVFNYGIRHGWAAENLADRIDRPSVEDSEPGIFTVEQAENLLTHANKFGLLPYIAIGLFAGLRSMEMLRLDWRAVNLSERAVVVSADVAKRRARRVVAMPDALLAWLELCDVKPQGPIVALPTFRKRLHELREAAGITNWPHNGLRHSFGSYHFADCGDASKTANLMGNSVDMVHKHYKALVYKGAAQSYWAIRPKVVSLENTLPESVAA